MQTTTLYLDRCQKLLHSMANNSLALIPAAAYLTSSSSQETTPQNNDFYYLTGIKDTMCVLVLLKEGTTTTRILFHQTPQAKLERWHGPMMDHQRVVDEWHFDHSYPLDDLHQKIPAWLLGKEALYTPMISGQPWDQQLTAWIAEAKRQSRRGLGLPSCFYHTPHLLAEMRLIKNEHEIQCLRQAAQYSAQAHLRIMQQVRPGMHEYHLEAIFRHELLSYGVRELAYPPIMGSGANSCILHYNRNDTLIEEGDMILIDAGGRWQGYCADISRSFPAKGRFSPQQKDIYDIVLAAQQAALAKAQVGQRFDAMQQAIVQVITQGLIDVGLLTGDCDTLIEEEAYLSYYMHSSGHWLGLDVHDPGCYRCNDGWRILEPGMVFTIEPGIYIDSNPAVAPKWHNIGIRIEDDVLLTPSGPDILSCDIPSSPQDIEQIMGG